MSAMTLGRLSLALTSVLALGALAASCGGGVHPVALPPTQFREGEAMMHEALGNWERTVGQPVRVLRQYVASGDWHVDLDRVGAPVERSFAFTAYYETLGNGRCYFGPGLVVQDAQGYGQWSRPYARWTMQGHSVDGGCEAVMALPER